MKINIGDIAKGFQILGELLGSDTPAADLFINTDISAVTVAGGFNGVPAFHFSPSVTANPFSSSQAFTA